jgi:hypothetical protein
VEVDKIQNDLGPSIIQVGVNNSPSRDLANKAINNHQNE